MKETTQDKNSPAVRFGLVHFVGIGGIGMCGIAEVMLNIGFRFRVPTRGERQLHRLRGTGRDLHRPCRPKVEGAVASWSRRRSAATTPKWPQRARPISGRPPRRHAGRTDAVEVLDPVAGTHGKTTTTSIVAALLDAGGLDPTVVNGGIINAYGANARLGDGDWIVVEADESDGCFLRLKTTVAIVTNIDPEHLEHYGDFEARQAFFDFIENIPSTASPPSVWITPKCRGWSAASPTGG